MNKKLRIYIAGYSKETDFRDYVHKQFDNSEIFEILDPILISNYQDSSKVVNSDKMLIKTCDLLVVYIRQPSWGTAMEIIYAHDIVKIPIYVINPQFSYADDFWLHYHTTKFFNSIDECFKFLKSKYINN